MHTQKIKKRLIDRVRRLRGQLGAVEKALVRAEDCSTVLHRLAACRGALNSLLVEIVESHIRVHIVDPDRKSRSALAAAAEELIDVVHSYFK